MNEVKSNFDEGVYQTDESSAPRFIVTLQAGNPHEESIVEFLKTYFNKDMLFANQSVFDLGIDSLGLIELIVSIEETLAVSVDEIKMQSLSTLEDMVAYLVSCPEKGETSLDDSILRSRITTKINYFHNPINAFILCLVKIASLLFWKFEIKNEEFLLTKNAIIAANHASYLDILWILASIPRTHRKNVFVTGKHELSFLKIFFPGAPIIFIKRGGNVLPALKASADILRSGKSLVIFPEGTRSRDGSLGDFKNGAAYLAKNLGKKIVPVKIHGAFEINPRGKILPRIFSKEKGALIAGEPLDPDRFQSIDEMNKTLKEKISIL